MAIYPTKIERTDDGGLRIQWSDAQTLLYSLRELRDSCPCATCREKRKQPEEPALLPVLSSAETRSLAVAGMKPVGNYAYGITFSDGHDTGIYSFELLRTLGKSEGGNEE